MSRIPVLISLLFCVATTPFFISSEKMMFGFPIWAFYSLIMIVIYSVIICYLLERYWPTKHQDK
ncbi:MAG TPA: hypothetical protein DD389_03860 [Candidatus Marinimicrobia bacterium]|nr:hypothetical protein [Candidatus Neomarinimicrobiota bacterium]|tara:strand:- start:8770 stop:8961 length:192 start_codon:yes stop_codon:yes gene_type:complete